MSRKRGPAAAGAETHAAPQTPPRPQPRLWQAPQYRGPSGRPLVRPLGAPPAVPMQPPTPPPVVVASSPPAATPPAAAAPPSTELEPAAARPRQWAPPSAASPGWEPPPANASHASNAYDQKLRERADREWNKAKDVAQGETLLVHQWAWAVTQYPPQGMMVWLFRTDPVRDQYEIHLDGQSLIGDWPDKKLFEEVRRQRRQPQIPERFFGRIRARLPDGTMVEIASGEIHLPPEPQSASAGGWAPPPAWGAPPPYGAPYGAPPYGAPPFGAPPYGYGAPPYGAPPGYFAPYGAAAGAPWWGQPPQQEARSSTMEKLLVEALTSGKGSPEVMKTLIEVMRENGNNKGDAAERMLQLVLDQRNNAPKSDDDMTRLTNMITLVDKLRPPVEPARGGINVHSVDGGKLVETRDGNLDVGASIGLSALPMVKDLLGKRFAAAATPKPAGRPVAQGPGVAKAPPPGPAAAPRMNGTHN